MNYSTTIQINCHNSGVPPTAAIWSKPLFALCVALVQFIMTSLTKQFTAPQTQGSENKYLVNKQIEAKSI